MEDSDSSEEILQSLNEEITRREHQIHQLSQILCVVGLPPPVPTLSSSQCFADTIVQQPSLTSPPLLVVHGVHATGKSTVLRKVLIACNTPSAIIASPECVTTRHLFERAIDAIKEALQKHEDGGNIPETDGKCESISIFVVELQRLLATRGKFILVFDAIDRQREASPTLLPALARLGEIIPNLSIVLIVTTPRPHLLQYAGVPHLHFPPYTRTDIISITTSSPLPISTQAIRNSKDPTSTAPDSDSAWLWTRFVAACYDSLGTAAARDLPSFRRLCNALWPPFVSPILDKNNGTAPGDYWPREFSKLMVKNRPLFQSEAALIPSILGTPPITAATAAPAVPTTPLHLPYYAAFLLIASYLASYNPARTDLTLLSKTSQGRKRRRRGAGATPRHSKNKLNTHQKLSRRLLGPQAFGVERLFAIFHAIMSEDNYKGGSAAVMGQFATLVSLRLVVRAGDESGGKWKCAVGWEVVKGISRDVGFVLDDFMVD